MKTYTPVTALTTFGFDARQAYATHEETIRRLVILIALYAIPAVMVMGPVLDPDIWSHLRTGQWIIEHGAVPQTDPFSNYGMGKPWIAYSWLFQVMVYGLYSGLGLTGILLYRIILSLAVVAAVHHFVAKREPRFIVAIGLVALATIPILPSLNERSWLFTILSFTLTLDVVLNLRQGIVTKMAWLLPPLYVLWANVHIQFVYGLFILALACAAPVGDRLLGRDQPGDHAGTVGSRCWWMLVALTGACFAATLLNPYHMRLYAVVVEYATQTVPYHYIQEHTAPSFRSFPDWVALVVAGAGVFALARRPKPSIFEVLLLTGAAYFSFRARRDVWVIVIVAVALIAIRRPLAVIADRFMLTKWRELLVVGTVVAVMAVAGHIRGISENHLESAVAENYPAAAAAVVEERSYPGPLYNHYNWGGYLIWRLPNLPVTIDGRTDVHGDEHIKRSLETWGGKNGWAQDPELVAARLVIVDVDGALASLLRLDLRFELVYEDKVAAVFIARQPPEG
jgi:hypothetical protein